MSQADYFDFSPEDVASFVEASKRGLNPIFFGGFARKLVWALFVLRSLPETNKQKIKEAAQREVIAIFQGKTPRFNVGPMALMPHNLSSAGVIDFLTLIHEIFIEDQYHARDFIREDSVVIDAGANVGIFSAFAASIATKGKVYAFEPAPSTNRILSENVKRASNITVVPLGLGEATTEKDMRVNAEFPGMSAIADTGIEGTGGISAVTVQKVKLTTLDDFVKKENPSRIDFIKMDTEGYEKNIISGARETIAKFKPAIAASAYHFPGDKEEIPRLVLGIAPGYRYFLSQRAEDDLIFHYGNE